MLSSIVLSRDWPEVCVLECILGGLDFEVDVETEAARVQAKLAKSKVDALIVDCAVEGSAEVLRGLRQDPTPVPLLIFGTANHFRTTDGAFVFEKPISVEQAVRTLSAARSLILDGRLRYHRHRMDVSVAIRHGKKRSLVELVNLSQGGVAVRTGSAPGLPGRVQIEFTLPGDLRVKVQGELVWQATETAGFRFVGMTPDKRRDLQLWLAQNYLSNDQRLSRGSRP